MPSRQRLIALRSFRWRKRQIPELDLGVNHLPREIHLLQGIKAGVHNLHHPHLHRSSASPFGGGVPRGKGVEGGSLAALGKPNDSDVHAWVALLYLNLTKPSTTGTGGPIRS